MSVLPLSQRPSWRALHDHHGQIKGIHLRDLFSQDPRRGERLCAEADDIYLDFSKNRVTDETIGLLLQLADESGLHARINAMFSGEKINVSEGRAVLHVALRAPNGTVIMHDGRNVVADVHAVLDRMADFATRVRNGS